MLALLFPIALSPALLVFWLIWQTHDHNSVKALEQNKLTVKRAEEDWSMLMERMSAPVELTPADIEDQANIINDQIANARRWLESRDAMTRIKGAEQLSAYPTEEAENLLVATFLSEREPEVRVAIVRTLAYVKTPQQNTLAHLYGALENDTEEVQMQVLHTITTYVAREPYASKRANEIIGRLKQINELGIVHGVVHTVLQNFLSDQSAQSPQN